MKWLFSLILFLIQVSAFAFEKEENCLGKNLISEQVAELSCDVADIAYAIINQDEIVPKNIYHLGKREVLDKDIKARTVPKEDWDKFIMGDSTTFELAPSRRGLYGTSTLDTNTFINEAMIEIAIKDECRQPTRVATLLNLHEDPRFVKWYKTNKDSMSIEEFSQVCGMIDYQKYDDPRCEKLVTDFLDSHKIAVIQDHIIKKSFYIRERSCIETIRGTPEEIIDIFATNPELWMHRCNEMGGWNYAAMNNQQHLFTALNKVKSVEPKKLKQLLENSRLLNELVPQGVEAILRCKEKKVENHYEDYFLNFPELSVNYKEICR